MIFALPAYWCARRKFFAGALLASLLATDSGTSAEPVSATAAEKTSDATGVAIDTTPTDQRWRQAAESAQHAVARGAFAQAEHDVDEALKLAAQLGPGTFRLAQTHVLRGEIYRAEQKLDQAEECFKLGLSSGESAVGTENSQLATPLESLAGFYFLSRQRYDLALPLCLRLLKLLERAPVRDDREIARQASNLAGTYEKLGKYTEAEPYYLEALRLAAPSAQDVSKYRTIVIDFYREWKKFDQAESLARQALEERRTSSGARFESAIEGAVCYYKLAEIYADWNKPELAEANFTHALAITEKAAGPVSSAVVPPLIGRAEALEREGKAQEAEADYKRALTVATQTMDPREPQFATLVQNYLRLLESSGRIVESKCLRDEQNWRNLMYQANRELKANHRLEAGRLCNEAIAVARTFAAADLSVSNSLILSGEILRGSGNLDEAENTFLKAVNAAENALGEKSSGIIPSLESLANFYYYTRVRLDEVARIYQRILAISDSAASPDLRDIARRTRNLADVYHALGRNSESEILYQRALASAENIQPRDNQELVQYIYTLAEFYRATRHYNQAEELGSRALIFREKAAGSEPDVDARLDIAVALDALAETYLGAGKPAEAEPLYRRSTMIIESIDGAESTDLIPRLTGLAAALSEEGKPAQAEVQYKRALAIAEKNPASPEFSAIAQAYAAFLNALKRPEEARMLLAHSETADRSAAATAR